MKKLRIGIMGTRGIPNHYGGFEQFAEYLSCGLVQRGHEVFVYNSGRHPYQKPEWNGVQLIHCRDREGLLGTVGQFLYDWNCIRDSYKRNFDILLHLGYTSDAIWYWRWPSKTIHMVNVDGMEWTRSKYNYLTRKFLKRCEGWVARHADILIADSVCMQAHFIKSYSKTPLYIAYGARPFTAKDAKLPVQFGLKPGEYFLLVARMEPENNVEMIIQGYLASQHPYPLVATGNMNTRYGKYIQRTYRHTGILFPGAVFDAVLLNNLRYFSARYFHGHSAGGTNPSLLEAMACSCTIAAHDNPFNRAVLGMDADYFSNVDDITSIIHSAGETQVITQRRNSNIEKIINLYDREKNIADYEQAMLTACCSRKESLPVPIAEVA